MADQDRDTKPLDDAELPDDEALDEETDESTEAEGEEYEGDAAAVAAASGSRRFGFGRGQRTEDEGAKRHIGSVRESHERVHINDVPSAIYALLAAGSLIGVLVVSWAAGALPKKAAPTYAPLVVPTAQATPVSSPSVSISVNPSASASAAAASKSPAPTK